MLKCNEQNLAANTSEPAVSMDCRVKPGNDDMESRSRGAFFVRVRVMVQAEAKNSAAPRSSSEKSGSGRPDVITIRRSA
jgi:hypothetical protein